MLWIHDIEIDEEQSDPGSVDSTFGQPVGQLRSDPIYRGKARVMDNQIRMSRLAQGDDRLRADFYVYLPPGAPEMRVDYLFRWGDITGRVSRVSIDTGQFYTQLEVRLETR